MSRWRPLLRSDPAPPWVPGPGPSGPRAARLRARTSGLCSFATSSHTSRSAKPPYSLLHSARTFGSIRRLRGVRLLSGSREKDRNLRRITRLVLVVVAVFVGCWTPVQVFVLVQGLGVQPGSETVVAILRFCTALGYVNSCLNPILYAFLDENFKACFRKFCCAPTLRREMQVSDRVRSIAKDVAHARKTSEVVPRPA